MTNKSILYEALADYQVNLQIGDKPYYQSEVDAALKCMDYLDNEGSETKDWLLSNSLILARAVHSYRKTLENNIKDAKAQGNDDVLECSRQKRAELQKYIVLFEKYKDFII